MEKQVALRPITKWVGGKRQLLPELHSLMPSSYDIDSNTYFEPFLGGGAMLFSLAPKKAVINDLNADLINLYRVVRDKPEELLKLLEEHQANNSKEYYLKVRAEDRNENFSNLTKVERAARLLYMLKVDFNGMYRVNSKGQFNVPYGRYKNPKIADYENIMTVSEYLNKKGVEIYHENFSETVQKADKGDLVYFDPPYIPLSETANFTSYTSEGFNNKDQEELRDLFFKLSNRGVNVMLSNSDTPKTREMYAKANIHEVQANRAINSNAKKRGKIGELIITNY
ncbi:DNA adenine methylase [Lactobacillus sp. ESL0731]|uniref:DNA adenine methylase n=1 Tax=unclassified Lactobacillus TaxID=2620435 RepID=UPI0023F7431D|nr:MULTISPECIES: DNA adenine methylase [unclassified Lactobacillus]WEV51603.1 DNA adenine methylase [Lactobacillus sp. ESL0700]WEV62732.1 DNA adenine methylase [Lactobacillus sp. ESL0731]